MDLYKIAILCCLRIFIESFKLIFADLIVKVLKINGLHDQVSKLKGFEISAPCLEILKSHQKLFNEFFIKETSILTSQYRSHRDVKYSSK